MAEKKCKACGMLIPADARRCPYCRKRQGWSLTAKIFAFVFITGVIVHALMTPQGTNPPQTTSTTPSEPTQSFPAAPQGDGSLGNNVEAAGFAKALTDLANARWPKGHAVLRLELTPQQISGPGIVDYRKKVSFCKATMSIDRDAWFAENQTDQHNFLKTVANTLHREPIIRLSKVIDYYPNCAGEVSVLVDGKVVATAKFAKGGDTAVAQQPNTYRPDEVGRYTVKITVQAMSSGIIINGSTNNPDSSLVITLSGRAYSAQSRVFVHQGVFSTETFTKGGDPLPFGKYSIWANSLNPRLEATGTIDWPNTESLTLTFGPTKL